ncbi:MAG: dicarboxylate/amino acid:cation symporter [Muribaculaceae bacterium]|nr:dicarboxylate/amino acid:cation symporter [Muribaculaceae bacterium]
MKLPRIGLLGRIIIAMALGIGAAYIFPEWAERLFITFNGIFSEFLGFLIPLLIVGFVAPAIMDIGKGAGKMLLATAFIAYAFTLGAGMISYFTGDFFFPGMIQPDLYLAAEDSTVTLKPYFEMDITPLMNVMTALVFAFVIGLGGAMTSSTSLRHGFEDFRSIIIYVINKAIIPLLPLYIFGIFMNMTVSGQVGSILMTFIKVIGVIFALHIGILVLQYVIASFFSGKNPFKSLLTMLPAYFTALGTQSSAATIPVTLKQTVKLGVNPEIAGFTVPLCATIHMSGSTLKIVACALALMIATGMHYDLSMFMGFIAMLGITIIAAPGVPGGAIMASLGLLSSMLGFTEADNALMIALYIAMDSFGTACNVTGDGAIAQIIDRLFSKAKA